MSIADKLITVGKNQQKVYDAGKEAQYDQFWDAFQNYGERTDYSYAFYRGYSDANFYPKYDLNVVIPNGVHSYTFANNTITDLKGRLEECGVKLNTENNTRFSYMFYGNRQLTHVPELDMRNANYIVSMFSANSALHTIDKLILSESGLAVDLTFTGCLKLENIVIEGKIAANINMSACPLTAASVQSIIDALKDLTGSTTKTLTFKSDVGAALTDTQKATITAKNWTLVY